MEKDIKKSALKRLNILKGQIEGISEMIQNEEYCTDIINQSRAIQQSLKSLDGLILENHIKTHITEMFLSKNIEEKSKAIRELMKIYQYIK